MSGPKPLLSIVVPTYQRLRELQSSLPGHLAIVDALAPEVELLVSDNCTSDGSWDYIQTTCAGHPGVRLRREPVTVNSETHFYNACSEADGKYVWGIGDDDEVYLDAVAELLPALADTDEPMIFMPFDSTAEGWQMLAAREDLVDDGQPLRLRTLPCLSAKGVQVALAMQYRSANLGHHSVYPGRMKNYESVWYNSWTVWAPCFDTMAERGTCTIVTRPMGYANRWQNIGNDWTYFPVFVIGFVKTWAATAPSPLKQALIPSVRRTVLAGLFWDPKDECVWWHTPSLRAFARSVLRAVPRFLSVLRVAPTIALTCPLAAWDSLARRRGSQAHGY